MLKVTLMSILIRFITELCIRHMGASDEKPTRFSWVQGQYRLQDRLRFFTLSLWACASPADVTEVQVVTLQVSRRQW